MIEVFVVDLDNVGVLGKDSIELLDETEREKLHRFRRAAERRQYLVGRVLLRTALSQRYGGEPGGLRFATDEKGKSRLLGVRNAKGVDFNVSHSDGIVVAAIAEGCRVGVDVERMDDRAFEGLDGYFTARERRELARKTGDARKRIALRMWTAKEAYSKLLGVGLELEFSDLDTSRFPHGVCVETREISLPSGTYFLSIAQNDLVTEKIARGARVTPSMTCG